MTSSVLGSCDGCCPQLNGKQLDWVENLVKHYEQRTKIIVIAMHKTIARACSLAYLENSQGKSISSYSVGPTNHWKETQSLFSVASVWGGGAVIDILWVNKHQHRQWLSFQREDTTFSSVDIFKIEKCVYLIRIILRLSSLKAEQTKTPQIPSQLLIAFGDGVGLEGINGIAGSGSFPIKKNM